MSEIGSFVLPEIEQAFSHDTQESIRNDFNAFLTRVQLLLDEINKFSTQVAKVSEQIEKHDDGTLSGSKIIRNLKQTQAIADWDITITNLLIKGTQLISEIRTYLTGETIKYQIGIMYYGKIYEFEIPESVLLDKVRISYSSKRTDFSKLFTLRLGAKGYGKGSLIKQWQEFQLSSGIGRFSTQQIYKNFSKKYTKNQGNIYEATKKYQYYQGRKSKESVFSDIASNIISSTKGGDFNNIQYKFFGRSAPTLADMSVIVNTLQACLELFSLAPVEMGNRIKELFIKERSQIDTQIEIQSIKDMNKHVDELISILKV